jgi:hypothetical protein
MGRKFDKLSTDVSPGDQAGALPGTADAGLAGS